MRTLSLSACSLLLSAACSPREAGPSEGEEGYVFIWETTTAAGGVDSCAAELSVDDPEEGWVGLYIGYRIDDDLETATGMTCATSNASDCTADPEPYSYVIEGHRLSWTTSETIDQYGDCDIGLEVELYVVDDGDSGTWGFDLQFLLTGDDDDCEELDDLTAADDPEGFGIADCMTEVSGELELVDEDSPSDE